MISIYAFVFLRKILREDGGFSFFRVMVLRGEIIMNTLVIVLIAAVCLFCGYTFYGRWLAKKWGIDPKAKTPAVALEDGQDYVPTDGWTVFAHQFSSIAGAGPVTGAIQAAAFGWVPVLLLYRKSGYEECREEAGCTSVYCGCLYRTGPDDLPGSVKSAV